MLPWVRSELGAAELHRVLRPGGKALFAQRRPATPLRLLGVTLPGRSRGDQPEELLARWRTGFSDAELRTLRLPAPTTPAGGPWEGLARLASGLRTDAAYTALLLSR